MSQTTNGMNSDENLDIQLQILQNLQSIVPTMKQDFDSLTKKFAQFSMDIQQLDKILSNIHLLKQNQVDLQIQLDQIKQERIDIEKRLVHNADDRVHLDIGGVFFTTTIKTLTQQDDSTTPNTFFTTLIAEKWRADTNTPENRIFLDRDGRLFDSILKYLRTGNLNVDDDKHMQKELLIEAKYYKLQSLENELLAIGSSKEEQQQQQQSTDDRHHQNETNRPRQKSQDYHQPPIISHSNATGTNPRSRSFRSSGHSFSATPRSSTNVHEHMPNRFNRHPSQTATSWRHGMSNEQPLYIFNESLILTSEFEEKLIEFIGQDLCQQPWQLIYQATSDGFHATDFHRCCGSAAPTLSIIQSDVGNIFGGFTSVGWSSATQRCHQADSTAFLFTLKNMEEILPTKFPVLKDFEYCAVSHNPTCGPNFGSPKNDGSDLCLRGQFDERNNCVYFPRSYEDSTGIGSDIFAKRYFACREVEVFTSAITN